MPVVESQSSAGYFLQDVSVVMVVDVELYLVQVLYLLRASYVWLKGDDDR